MALHDKNESSNPVLPDAFALGGKGEESEQVHTQTKTEVPSISSIMSNYSNNNTLEEGKGKEYLDTVLTKLKELMGEFVVIPINTNSIACRIIADPTKSVGVALLFAETYSNSDVPPTEHLSEVMSRLRRVSDVAILQTIVIAEEDYVKAHNMANHIESQIDTNMNDAKLNIVSFKRDSFVCTADINRVRKFISDYSPHGVPARVDVGILLSALVEKEGPVRFGESKYDEVPILAIGGYTSYTLNNNLYQFGAAGMNRAQATNIACVNITEIVANRAYREFISIAVPIATHHLIKNNGWLNAYNTYAPHVPNLGNLVMDQETRKLSVCTNQTERDNFVMEHIQCPPYIAIDISDGRARISGIDHYAQEKSAYRLKADIETFLGVNMKLNHDPVVSKTKNFDGYVKNKDGIIVDSRNIDYLYLCCNNVDLETASKFMVETSDPSVKVTQIKGVHPDMRPLYSTTKVVLHGEFISKLGSHLENAVRIKFDSVNHGMFGTSSFLNGIGPDVNNYNNYSMGINGGNPYGNYASWY